MSSNVGSKRKKSYYGNAAWKRCKGQHETLEKHVKGFLITCNNRERECVQEAYVLLGQFADKLYGPEQLSEGEEATERETKKNDIDAEIAKEIEKLKKFSSKSKERRFQSVDCGAKNCVFIKTKIPDPCELVLYILTTIQTDQKQRSRFILRLIPVSITCRSALEDIQNAIEPLLPKYFKDTSPDGKTFAIVVKIRNNNTIKRDDIIETLAPMIRKMDANNKVDLKTPQLSVVVEIIGKITCLSVVSDYFQFKKYNVVELIGSPKETPKIPDAASKLSDGVVEVHEANTKPSVATVEPQADPSVSTEPTVEQSLVTSPESEEVVPVVSVNEIETIDK